MPPAPRRRSTRYRPASNSPTRSSAKTWQTEPSRLKPTSSSWTMFEEQGAPSPARDPGTPTHLLADDDAAPHRRTVHGAIIRVGTQRGERDSVALRIAGLDCAARDTGPPLQREDVPYRCRHTS